MRNTINAGIQILLYAAAVLFAACQPLGGDFEEWRKKAIEDAGGVVPGKNLAAQLKWLDSYAASNRKYVLEVKADESISGGSLGYGKKNITITLKGIGANRTISLSSNRMMFRVNSGVTLVLDNITLKGRIDNTESLVKIDSGGTLVMNPGSVVTGNTYSYSDFSYSSNSYSESYGGGVYVDYGTFTMNGGTISGNTATNTYGGGVYVRGGTFTMNGGTISSNTASSFGGGGGVYVYSGTFTMSGGTISGNTASSFGGGGGVYVDYGTFTMSGGTISSNTAFYGGGVYVGRGTFNKTGGTIYGYSADDANSNVTKDFFGEVKSNQGHAVYVYISAYSNKRKETTAGSGVNLSFNGSNGSFSGDWDY